MGFTYCTNVGKVNPGLRLDKWMLLPLARLPHSFSISRKVISDTALIGKGRHYALKAKTKLKCA